jgi:hypothetical protein
VRWARLVLAVALLGGCSGGRDDDTLPPPATTSSTTADYSVPEVIDVAYVERVMAALDHVYGDAIRTLSTERTINEEFLNRLKAIYTRQQFAFWQDVWVKDAAEGLHGLRSEPGDPKTLFRELVIATPTCVLARVDRDFSSVNEQPDRPTPQEFIALVPAVSQQEFNPTPWIISFDGYVSSPEGAQPEAPCDAS